MTKENVIDAKRAIELLTAAVEERGEDYIYPEAAMGMTCRYMDPTIDQPSCIVGLALTRAGVSFVNHVFQNGGRAYVNGPITSVRQHLERLNPGLHITVEAERAFRKAQLWQDSGEPWGRALAAALKTYATMKEED